MIEKKSVELSGSAYEHTRAFFTAELLWGGVVEE
jgi:hypothetical protein